ncbi:MAG: ABC transporter ATP-binding protein [Methanomassiliicoccales archaeon]|nr:ABC transporter ATP-binding protein [Methanomassiliicoccales archaeon]
MMMNVDGVEFRYGSLKILDKVGFSLDRSEILTILGPNGVGKTTLLKCLNRILRTMAGTVLVEEEDLLTMSRLEVAKKVGYVPQRGDVSRITVFDSVLLGRKPYIRWDITSKDVEMANGVIERLGLGHLALRYVNEISGGEYQKVQIARALVQEPQVLLLDEPTSNLDLSNQHRIMCAVTDIVKKNRLCAVLTMHDLNLSLRFSDRFIMMKGGMVFAAGGHEIITPENIEAVYDIPVIVEKVLGRPMVVPA